MVMDKDSNNVIKPHYLIYDIMQYKVIYVITS